VLGDAAAWSTVEPASLSLFPDAEENVLVWFRPPRSAEVPAGQVPFAVRVLSHEDQEGSVVQEGLLEISHFVDAFAELSPRTSRGRRAAWHDLSFNNRGNSRVESKVTAADPDKLLGFAVSPPRLGTGALGEPINGRIAVNDTAGNGEPTAKAFDVGAQQALAITDLVVQNPNGDRGRLTVRRGDEVILVEALENLRDLDFHFVAPIVLREQDLVVEVNCEQEGKPQQQETCEESVSFVGFIASLQPAATVPPTTAAEPAPPTTSATAPRRPPRREPAESPTTTLPAATLPLSWIGAAAPGTGQLGLGLRPPGRGAGVYEDDIEAVLLDERRIQEKVAELADRISRDYAGHEVLLVGVLKGAVVLMADLCRRLTVPHEVDFMAVSSYGAATESSGVVRLLKDLDTDLGGKHVILIEDIVDSGLTLDYLVETLSPRRPASLEVCVLLTKPEKLQTDLKVRYKGFDIPSAFVVGYGLDYAERYRSLPFLATLRPEVYETDQAG
jgi:hypoxanthine phosphoribosyltransferase